MLLPSIFGEDLFDDWFDFPDTRDLDKAERKLYGRHANRLMKTDVEEKEDSFVIEMDPPGCAKEDIQVELKDGYLTISATKTSEVNESGENGRYIRKERFEGSAKRSFFVGDYANEENISAAFKDGVLTLEIPKEKEPEPEQPKRICIN